MMLRFRDLNALGVPHNQGYVCKLIKAGKFPQPFKDIEGNVLWPKEKIETWVAARLAAKVAAIQASGYLLLPEMIV